MPKDNVLDELHELSVELAKVMVDEGITLHTSYVNKEDGVEVDPGLVLKVTVEYVDEAEAKG